MANKYPISVVKKAKALFESGKSTKQIAKMKNMPSELTLKKWIMQNHGGEWNVMVRQRKSFIDPVELEEGVQKYFEGLKVKCGEWERGEPEYDEDGKFTGYHMIFIPSLDGNGEQLYQLKTPPTWVGLALSLGCSTHTLDKYLRGDNDDENKCFSEILEIAKNIIHQYNIVKLYDKETVNGAKFVLSRDKNFRNEYDDKKQDDDSKRSLEDFLLEE